MYDSNLSKKRKEEEGYAAVLQQALLEPLFCNTPLQHIWKEGLYAPHSAFACKANKATKANTINTFI
jgi:hypothetical protein